MPNERETPEERAAWKAALAYHPSLMVALSLAAFGLVMSQAQELGIRPVRLVVGPTDRLTLNSWVGLHPSADGDLLTVPSVESFRIVQEGGSHFVMEIVTGDFPDDGRWYVEDHAGRRAGSL